LILEFENENVRFPSQMPRRQMSDVVKRRVENYLKQLKICYAIPDIPHSKRIYRVNSFGEPASRQRFKHGDEYITVEDYFAHYKNYKLAYPDMPVLCVGSKQRENPIALPPEVRKSLFDNITNKL